MATDRSSNQPASAELPPGAAALSPTVRKRLQRCFERGKEVTRQEKPDFDYAHTMFSECVLQDPGNLDYVETMLENLQRKFKNNKRGSRLKGFGGRGPFKKAIAAEDWDDVFRLGLELLRVNPWDVPTLRALAEACRVNHLNEVELRYLKNALDVNRKDVEVNRHCAESLARMGQFDQAIHCWHRVEELDKGNAEARRKISELTLAKARGLPGVETSSGSSDEARSSKTTSSSARKQHEATSEAASQTPKSSQNASDKPEAPSPEAADEGPRTILELERAVQKDAADLDAYRELAQRYTDEGRFRDALQTLKRALEAAGGNHLELRELLEDAQVRMVRAQVAVAEKRAAAESSAEAADLARRFRAELNRQELQVLSARCERYPDDLTLQYELALRLKREGNFFEARKAFDRAREAAHLKPAATLEMGECFQQLKQYSNALKCYQAASSIAKPESDTQKLALYRAGVLAAALKQVEVAEQNFTRLLKLDSDFRDTRARLDKLSQIDDKK